MAAPFKSTRDVMIKVKDLEADRRFYQEALGLELFERTERYLGFETGGFRLFVGEGAEPGPVFEFRVPDLTTAKNKLLAVGCRIVEDNPQVPRLYLHDPYGLTFNLDRR